MKNGRFKELVDMMVRLREPGGCPWDREQTLESLKDFLIEESYEVVEAIDAQDFSHIREELGDLLYQILFIARVCEEKGFFCIGDVIDGIASKIKRRHPHVFGNERAHSSRQVLERWEEIKLEEKNEKRGATTLSGIPHSLPALLKAKRISDKVARIGFDWEHMEGLLDKLDEEISELHHSIEISDQSKIEEELGDLFFVLVNVGRKMGIDPERALQRSNTKFIKRFEFVERQLNMKGKKPASSTLEEMETLWKEAKEFD